MELLPVIWFDSLPSTNTHLRAMVDGQDIPAGTVIAARQQTSGRGRFDRVWVSGCDENIACSIYLELPVEPAKVVALPLVIGLAVADALGERGLDCGLKWPNDVLVDGRKICGILMELVDCSRAGGVGIIVGFGINVNMPPERVGGIDKPATSLLIETGQPAKIDDVLSGVLVSVSSWVKRWLADGFEPIAQTWLARSKDVGRAVTITEPGQSPITGKIAGLGQQGQLLLTQQDGQTREIWSGDVVVENGA